MNVVGLDRRNIFKKNAPVQTFDKCGQLSEQASISSYEDQLIKEISTSLRKRGANTPLWIIKNQFPAFLS
jgi:hypothetical protein